MDSVNDQAKTFNFESKKLESMINNASKTSELSLSDIIQIYYQIMNVTSLITLLQKHILQEMDSHDNDSLNMKIDDTLKLISDKFDSNLHPSIMAQLANSIANATKNLTSGNSLEKSKDDVESGAKLYEQLREMMSTKEFVEQYDKGLSHD